MNTVLVPIDGSDSAMHALAHALQELRNRQDAQVHVLNVQERPSLSYSPKNSSRLT